MTTEREQLELAAKAMGYQAYFNKVDACQLSTDGTEDGYVCFWNPARDDGDCARMEAQLGISVNWTPEFVASDFGPIYEARFYKDYDGDKNAARRAASVAVAAEIGRMK